MVFLSEEGKRALSEAVEKVETSSAVEIVISIRRQSSSYRHVDLIVGAAAAYACLLIMLLSPWPFSVAAIALEPPLVGLGVALIASRMIWPRRALTSPSIRRSWVEGAAAAQFVARGIHDTRDRSGILIYISLLERELAVVTDTGVNEAVPPALWRETLAPLTDAVRTGADATTVAAHVAAMAPLFARVLPRRDDDVNELSDDIDAES